MNEKVPFIKPSLRSELKVTFSISFVVFLFFLFFQPLTTERFDFNNNLIFLAGFALIIFLITVFFRIIMPGNTFIIHSEHPQNRKSYVFNLLLILIFSSVAFAFYSYYVGDISFTFPNMLKLFLICLASTLVLWQHDLFSELKHQNESLISEQRKLKIQLEKFEQDYENISLVFSSENQTESFSLPISDVVFIKSADNYVEIVHRDGDQYHRKLLRNTLKNIELQFKSYSNFIRCHRTCIVNIYFIDRLKRDSGNYKLILKGYDEHVPVSRQYLLKIKESI